MTKLVGFAEKNETLILIEIVLCVPEYCKNARFPNNTFQFCVIARRAHFSARRGNLKVEGMGSRNEVYKHETRQGKKQKVLVPNVERIPFCSVFPCFVPGYRLSLIHI